MRLIHCCRGPDGVQVLANRGVLRVRPELSDRERSALAILQAAGGRLDGPEVVRRLREAGHRCGCRGAARALKRLREMGLVNLARDGRRWGLPGMP